MQLIDLTTGSLGLMLLLCSAFHAFDLNYYCEIMPHLSLKVYCPNQNGSSLKHPTLFCVFLLQVKEELYFLSHNEESPCDLQRFSQPVSDCAAAIIHHVHTLVLILSI